MGTAIRVELVALVVYGRFEAGVIRIDTVGAVAIWRLT